MSVEFKEVVDPADRHIDDFAVLLRTTFADENICLSSERMREFLPALPGPERSFYLVVLLAGARVPGGTLFSCSVATGAGFSEYMVLSPQLRGQGISRRLFEYRRQVLDRQARHFGHPRAPGLLIEVENPERTPAEYVARERESAMDVVERPRYFSHLEYLRLDFDYVQPPLGQGQAPVEYLDLLFHPWDPAIQEAGAVPAGFLVASPAPV